MEEGRWSPSSTNICVVEGLFSGTVYCNYRSRCKGKRLETTPEEKRPTANSYTLTFAIGSSKDCGVKGRRNLPARHLAVG